MSRDVLPGFVVGLVGFGLAVGVDLAFWGNPVREVLFAGLVAGLSGGLAWWVTGRWSLAWAGGFAGAFFGPVHEASWGVLAACVVPAVLLVVPSSSKGLHGVLVGAVAGWVVWLIGGWFPGVVVSVAVGVVLVLLRPVEPTRGQVRGLRAASLFGPGVALAGVFALNAVSGRGGGWLVVEGLSFGVSLGGLFVLLGVAGLGLSTLLESADPSQAGAWSGVALGVAAVVGVAPGRVFAWAVEASALFAVPAAVLVSTCMGRFDTDGPWPNVLGWGFLLVAGLSQVLF